MKKIILSIFCLMTLFTATKAQINQSADYIYGYKGGVETAEIFKKQVIDANPTYGIVYDIKYYKPDSYGRTGIDLSTESDSWFYGSVAVTVIVIDPMDRLIDVLADNAIAVQSEYLLLQSENDPTSDEKLGMWHGFMARISGKR